MPDANTKPNPKHQASRILTDSLDSDWLGVTKEFAFATSPSNEAIWCIEVHHWALAEVF